MSTDPKTVDPYEVVLRDLRAKRDDIDKTIQMIETVRGYSATTGRPAAPAGPETADTSPRTDAGAFLGLTIPEATKKLLARERRHLTNPEIAEGLKAGGLVMRSDDPANTIGSVLKRRQEEVGDVVRVTPGRGGKWGLTEWNPHLRKKVGPRDNGGDNDAMSAPVEDES